MQRQLNLGNLIRSRDKNVLEFIPVKKIYILLPAILLGAFSIPSFANLLFEHEGIGYAKTSLKACEDAIVYVKKSALDSAGMIFNVPVTNSKAKKVEATEKAGSVDLNQLVNVLAKVTSKDELIGIKNNGKYICHVKAMLSIDMDGVLKHNSAYKGQLPDWVVAPPRISGKITVIESAKTLDAALARTLFKYAEIMAGEREKIYPIKNLLNLKSSPYVYDAQINPDISVNWKRKYYMYGDTTDSYFIHTFSEHAEFKKNGKIRRISAYREIESVNGFVSNFEDETSGETKGSMRVSKATASLQMVVNSLKNSGFDIQYQQVTSGIHKEWYVMFIGAQPVKSSGQAHLSL